MKPAILRLASENRKLTDQPETRPVAATYKPLKCRCPLYSAGCYAQSGNVGIHASRLRARTATDATREEARLVATAPVDGRPLRLQISGDCTTPAQARLLARAVAERTARGGGPAWTYTHYWNRIPRTAWGRISILASTESPEELDKIHARGYAAALVVRDPETYRTPAPFRGIPCPNDTRGTTCVDCRLCWDDARLRDRRAVILFRAKGKAKELAQ